MTTPADNSYPQNKHKYTTKVLNVVINAVTTPLSAVYTFSDQNYTDIYKAGEMVTNQANELPLDESTDTQYWADTYIIYVDSTEKAYHVKTGTTLELLKLTSLDIAYYYNSKTKEWEAYNKSQVFNEEDPIRYYLVDTNNLVSVTIDGTDKKLANSFIYKYQGYSEDEVTAIYQVTSDFSEGASCCVKKTTSR